MVVSIDCGAGRRKVASRAHLVKGGCLGERHLRMVAGGRITLCED